MAAAARNMDGSTSACGSSCSSRHSSKHEGIDLVQAAYVYITEKTYPDGCTKSQKRAIRKKSNMFIVRHGILYYKKKKKKGKVCTSGMFVCMYVCVRGCVHVCVCMYVCMFVQHRPQGLRQCQNETHLQTCLLLKCKCGRGL